MTDYGFAFRNSSHQERPQQAGAKSEVPLTSAPWLGGGGRLGGSSFFSAAKEPEKKSNAEKQADVVEYLKRRLQSGKGPATITEISDATEVDLRKGRDEAVLQMLQANPKVEAVNEADPLKETGFVYVAKYAVSNKQGLLQLVNRCKGGICEEELKDTYDAVERDMAAAKEDGTIIAVLNKETNKINLYPRGEFFLTELPGAMRVEHGSGVAFTQEDMNKHIRRGEAIRLGNEWFRVSSETVGAQRVRSKAPLSVTMDQDLSSRNVYAEVMGAPAGAEGEDAGTRDANHVSVKTEAGQVELRYPLPVSAASKGFGHRSVVRREVHTREAHKGNSLPFCEPGNGLAKKYGGEQVFEGRAIRHGCSKALRELWRKTKEQVPTDPTELHQVMFKKGLTTTREGGPPKRPKRKAPDGSAKREQRRIKRQMKKQYKARQYKTVTNIHLEGTAIGKLLHSGGQGSEGGDRGGL